VPEFLPLQTMVFGALVLAYRLAVLSAGSALKSGPAASWDLFAVCIGAALPQAIAEWLRMRSRNENRTGAAIAEWVGLLVFVPCVLSYVWQPRALGGMLLGAAFGQILAPRPVNGGAFAGMSLSALIFGLMLVQTMPVLPLVGAPHRDVRIVLIAACALAVVVRLLIPVRPAPAAGRALS